MLTVWIAIDPATLENGPITYCIGSHRDGLLPHQPSGVAGNSMGLIEIPAKGTYAEFVGILDPGDALIHHCETIHWSAPNQTQQSRCGLLFVFCGSHTHTDPSLKADYESARA